MNRSTLLILLLAFAVPAGALAAASNDDSTLVCPNKGKPAAVPAPDAEAVPATPQGSASAKSAVPRGSATPTVRHSSQRWHSVLPGMIR